MIDWNSEPQYPIDAISLLKTDHRKVKNLFARYESAGNFSTKQLIAEQVFTGFCRKFSCEAICGMISLHDQQCIMRECDDGDQF
jgi:hypothetical protein